MTKPIVGFLVRNSRGQYLFGDNTYLSYRDSPVPSGPGDILVASFTFQMPLLPVGTYSISPAVADGTHDDHVQHHWIHDALLFESRVSVISHGLIGLPMLDVSLDKQEASAAARV